MELGMIRNIYMDSDEAVIELTPTYTGCPATDAIQEDLQLAAEEIHPNVRIKLVMTPAWTTDWISEETRVKMAQHGVAPPEGKSADKAFLLGEERVVPCPLCKTTNTKLVSPFGSTACKAHFTCLDCLEPFDHFKCI
jgi:ring-1,2-phenylacetyl-CoA epoxidase subunit PaaD